MKRVVLTAVNSRFVHTNPAVRLLRGMAPEQTFIVEGTMQDPPLRLLRQILAFHPDAVGFSGYIWNRDRMLELASALRKMCPGLVIFLGGPEFSFEGESFLDNHPDIDFIIPGEGETVYASWLEHWEKTEDPLGVPGTLCRSIPFEHVPLMDLEHLPFAYADELPRLADRSVYYETSRGCPGRCAFCLSGDHSPVRFMPFQKAAGELESLFAAGVSQIKLVDRTFNCHPQRACQIMELILHLDEKYDRMGKTNLHMEVRGDLLDDDFIALLEKAPPGLFQLEIGVQTTHKPTRDAIHRHDDLTKLGENIHRIKTLGNTHLHLDLIAGLPYEDMAAFEHSFNEILSMEPDMLQLGFLKLLPGSELHRLSHEYGLTALPFPPYEVVSTPWISFEELSFLKDIEAVLEWTYNAGAAKATLKAAANVLNQGDYQLYALIARRFRTMGMMDRPLSLEERYRGLYAVLADLLPEKILEGFLRHDWACHGKPNRHPDFMRSAAIPEARILLENEMKPGGFLEPLAKLSTAHRARLCHLEQYDPPLRLDGRSASLILYRYSEDNKGPRRSSFIILS